MQSYFSILWMQKWLKYKKQRPLDLKRPLANLSSKGLYLHCSLTSLFGFFFLFLEFPCKLLTNLTSMLLPSPIFTLFNLFRNNFNSWSQWFIIAWLQNTQARKFFKGSSFHESFINSQNEFILFYFCKKLNILCNIPIWQPTFQNSWGLKLEESALVALGYILVMNFVVWRINSLAKKKKFIKTLQRFQINYYVYIFI